MRHLPLGFRTITTLEAYPSYESSYYQFGELRFDSSQAASMYGALGLANWLMGRGNAQFVHNDGSVDTWHVGW